MTGTQWLLTLVAAALVGLALTVGLAWWLLWS